ncbi:MAG TPA: PDR/VanB family oxidoreductase [Burkholderiaceae bacterium]|nr:PDR/VanB family oxidoreductase [Burkholderiaceae bacterium]
MSTLVPTLSVRVAAAEALTPDIKSFRLVAANGELLPGYAPGAHLSVMVPPAPGRRETVLWRSYSLINFDPSAETTQPVTEYRIAVRRGEDERGGSRYLHDEVRAGDTLTLRPPTNNFPLDPLPEVLLLAGGIGVTPIISIASALVAQRRGFQLHYTGRTRAQLAYVDELRALVGDQRLYLHADDEADTRLSIEALLNAANPQQPIYVCGPPGMIDATLEIAQRRGWRREDLHFELFSEAQPLEGDQAFEVQLKSTGVVLTVPADKSILDTLLEAGVDMMYDCRAGYCGLCSTPVSAGEIEHRDTYLSAADKDSGRVMQVCVSRAKCARLVLDL